MAAPLPTRTGSLSIEAPAPEGPRSLVLFEFLAGDVPGVDLKDTKTMAASLAKLHRLSQSYSGPASHYVLDVHHLVHRPLDRLLKHPSMHEVLADRFSAIASELAAKIEANTQLTMVACHGDCHGGNTFMTTSLDGRRVGSFFDFDDGGPGYLAYDLAVYLWAMLLHSQDVKLTPEQSERWKYFVDGYCGVSPLPQTDLAAITLFVSARHFWFLGEYASRSNEWGSAILLPGWLQKQAEKLEQWRVLVTP